MNANFKITEAEAIEFSRRGLQDMMPSDITVGTIEIEKAPVPYNNFSLNRSEVSNANKIWLIKLVRQLTADLDKGAIKISHNGPGGTGPGCLSLSDSKEWVEKYLAINSRIPEIKSIK